MTFLRIYFLGGSDLGGYRRQRQLLLLRNGSPVERT